MNVSSVKFEQKPVGFNANIKFIQTGSKNLISKQSLEALSKKAESIGKETDTITIFLSQRISDKYLELQEETLKYYTRISGEYASDMANCYPYFTEIGNVYGEEQDRMHKSQVLIEHFIKMLSNALK